MAHLVSGLVVVDSPRPPGAKDAPASGQVTWPGDLAGTRAWLFDLEERWVAALATMSEERLGEEATFPWPVGSGSTVADMIAWANAELMKNVAELGQLRLLRAADTGTGDRTQTAHL